MSIIKFLLYFHGTADKLIRNYERERPKSLTRIKGAGALKLKNFMLRTGAIGSTAA